MIPLSSDTQTLVTRLFPPADQTAIARALEEHCTGNPRHGYTPEKLERLRFAVLKLSRGDREAFDKALADARLDFRDVLMGAGFGTDLDAHRKWFAEQLAR